MITITSYDSAGGLRENVPLDELRALLARPAGVVWVDLAAPTREESAILTTVFNFHPLALEDCETRRQHPKVDDYGSYLFILTHGVHPESSVREFRTRQAALFLGSSSLVSWHKEKSRSIEYTLETVRKNPRLLENGSDWLVYSILDFQIDQYMPVMDNFQRRVDEIEEECFTSPTATITREVFALRKALMRLRRISGYQREVIGRLARREFRQIDEKTAISLRDVHDHLVRVTDLAETYRELVAGALEAHLSIVSNRTNEIMRILTIFSTLFIPLTFIAGVYGMNFEDQPEYKWRYGYLYAMALMGAVAVSVMWYFRRTGVLRPPPDREIAAGRPPAGETRQASGRDAS